MHACMQFQFCKKNQSNNFIFDVGVVSKVPHNIEGFHRLLCKYTKLKDTAGQSARGVGVNPYGEPDRKISFF